MRRAEAAQANSRVLCQNTVRLLGTRAARIETGARLPRRQLAGGSATLDDALQPFARDVARELTPSVSNLWLRIEVMLAEVGTDQASVNVVSDLAVLHRLAGQIVAIVKGLSCFGQGSSLDIRPIELNAFLDEALPPAIQGLAPRGIAVRHNRGEGLRPIFADADALRYAVTSLIETVAETSATVEVTTRSGADGDVRLDVGASRKPGAARVITSRDPVRLLLADAIVRNFGGSVERHIGNPGTTFAISFRAAGARPAGARSPAAP